MEQLINMYPVKLPLMSLVQTSVIKIATHLWECHDIKHQMVTSSLLQGFEFYETLNNGYTNIFNTIFQKVDQLTNVPAAQRTDLKFVAMQIGINLFRWLSTIMDPCKRDLLDNLQWDRTGHIDAAQTYRFLYYSGNITGDTPRRLRALHDYCLKDCIDDYWCGVPRYERGQQLRKLFPAAVEVGLLLYWTQYVNGLVFGEPVQQKFEKGEVTLAAVNNVVRCPYQSFKYFWQKSSAEQRAIIIRQLDNLQYAELVQEGLVASVDSLNFLMERLTEAGNTEFSVINSEQLNKIIVDVLLYWPWQDLFLPMIRERLSSIDPAVFYHALSRINGQSYIEYRILGNTQRYHDLTMGLWRGAPRSVKLAMNSNPRFAACVLDILKVKDIDLLRIIFDDEDLAEVRRQLLNVTRIHWRQALRGFYHKNSEIFSDFVQHVLHTDEERQWFMRNIELTMPEEFVPPHFVVRNQN